jgi:hypothetical protein
MYALYVHVVYVLTNVCKYVQLFIFASRLSGGRAVLDPAEMTVSVTVVQDGKKDMVLQCPGIMYACIYVRMYVRIEYVCMYVRMYVYSMCVPRLCLTEH